MLRLLLVSMLVLSTLTLALPASIGAGARRELPIPQAPEGADSLPVSVYFPDSDSVVTMDLGEYLKGVVAAEMPADFDTEALKAQFVVARTYTVRRMKQFGGVGGCPLNPEADVCADFRTSQAYMTKEQLNEKYGPLTAASFWRRLSEAQTETEGEVLTYQGELIDALYHAVSGRMTENSGDYFTSHLPYLVPVDDTWGSEAPTLVEQRRFTLDEFTEALAQGGEAPSLAVTAAAQAGRSPVQVVERTEGGRVKQVVVGELTLTGREFRERLGLRSTDFRVFLQEGEVVVETFGAGHGVGMSQYGAQGMAKAGRGYREILSHYYTGVALKRLFDA